MELQVAVMRRVRPREMREQISTRVPREDPGILWLCCPEKSRRPRGAGAPLDRQFRSILRFQRMGTPLLPRVTPPRQLFLSLRVTPPDPAASPEESCPRTHSCPAPQAD